MTTKILVVDDSPVDRCLIAGLLTKLPGWDVETAEDGEAALAAIHADPPDLVVTDLVMPRMNGLELLKSIRRNHPDLPVILLTAHDNESIAVDALQAGAASYVPKARQAERLTETVIHLQHHLTAANQRITWRCFRDRWRPVGQSHGHLHHSASLQAPLDYILHVANRGHSYRLGPCKNKAGPIEHLDRPGILRAFILYEVL